MKATCSRRALSGVVRALHAVTHRRDPPRAVRMTAAGRLSYAVWSDGVGIQGSLPARETAGGTVCYPLRELHEALSAGYGEEASFGPKGIAVPTVPEFFVPAVGPKPCPGVYTSRSAFTSVGRNLTLLDSGQCLRDAPLHITEKEITISVTDKRQAVRLQPPRAPLGPETALLWIPRQVVGLLPLFDALLTGEEVGIGWSYAEIGLQSSRTQIRFPRANSGPDYVAAMKIKAKRTSLRVETAALLSALRFQQGPTRLFIEPDLRFVSRWLETSIFCTVEIAKQKSFLCDPRSLFAGAASMPERTTPMTFDDRLCVLTSGPVTFYSPAPEVQQP